MRGRLCLLAALLGLGIFPAQGQAPLSAIDWLEEVPTTPVETLDAPQLLSEPAVSRGVISEPIRVTPLDAPTPDAVGLLPRAISGLPATLWGPTPKAELIALLRDIETDDLLPATRELLYTLLLSELDPPIDSDSRAELFLARVDTLVRLGAIESAQALLERAGPDSPKRFARWFDLSLLLGTESIACERLVTMPGLVRALAPRVFCLARTGDWAAAALSFETGASLGGLDPLSEQLLHRFLDPEFAEGAQALAAPDKLDPLTFKLFESIGEPLPTTTLPLAFAHADLRPSTGWRAQIAAAERLTRQGAVPANKLLGLYTERQAAASGGIWTRVDAVQTLDKALDADAAEATSRALPIVWDEMKNAGLAPVFAGLYGERINEIALAGPASALAFELALLTKDYERAAMAHLPQTARERFLIAVARGDLRNVSAPNQTAAAIADGFLARTADPATQQALRAGALGATLLTAIKRMGEGANGDIEQLSQAIATFRVLGLEDAARRTALQVLILDGRG
ncbi:hypothetical protein AIOL_002162 [Candidatus Rhodobacter oscarellae]|uniref:Antifreeze glycopeptide polyprotein n=1 Tax=Candidatus Rhodobacter oscarellae TaxID=1675527 RepID=A0A0J9E2X2_9RHOB|nr:hypothetical protein [Candidatus Rhodobacter lobularis]KMW57201.1 hypothetical protein AIOL_002162 [Candidatus Rhodobacter lobularis]